MDSESTSVVGKNAGTTPIWLLAIIGLLGGLLLFFLIRFLLTGSLFGTQPFHGVVLQSPQQAVNFTLMGPDEQPVSLNDFRGKVVLLYFGYTFCPDACPATLSVLKEVRQQLGRRADDVQVVMITVDPERDTPTRLADYVRSFDPTFVGLSGTLDQTSAVATDYGIFFEKQPGTAATGYLVDHTATVAAIDKDGYLRLIFLFDMSAEEIAADVRRLLR
ncbi:MAG: SCO family protein [Anaerolineales bacterium]|nr:SCO family protein [Anaerolineales bacterium]MCB8950569.1 SCO family protein [Ardenticatenales bacterium]